MRDKPETYLRLYYETVKSLQDGKRITQLHIAEYRGMTAKNLRRYKIVENLEFFNKNDEIIQKHNGMLESQ